MKKAFIFLTLIVSVIFITGCSAEEEPSGIASQPEKEYSISEFSKMMNSDKTRRFETIAENLADTEVHSAAEEVLKQADNEFVRIDPEKEIYPIVYQIRTMTPETALKIHPLKDPDIIACYERDGNLSSNISDKYFIQINLFFEQAGIQFREDNDGTWKKSLAISGLGIPHSEADTSVPLTQLQMQEAVAKETDTVSDMRYIDVTKFAMKMVYFRTGGKEYVIPICTDPELAGLENGKTYSLEDAMEKMSKKIKADILK